MKPIIGILTDIDSDKNVSMPNSYIRVIEKAGGLPIVIPYVNDKENIKKYVELCDGILFSGGADVCPIHYGEEARDVCGATEPQRDEIELAFFDVVFGTSKPILGVCRGLQFINVALGGTLYQDLDTDAPSSVVHRRKEKMFDCYHSVRIVDSTFLSELLGKEELCVNSFHHQAIKTLGKGLVPAALAADGIVEALSHKGEQYLRAYQWHPERIDDESEDSHRIFSDFIDACIKAKAKEKHEHINN